MARFVVLKNGANYKVFDFEGNIARVGVGETMDLSLDAPGYTGDLFFLTKSSDGYEIERRNDNLAFSVNGATASNRVSLNDGDKVTFLNYLIIATYPPTLGPVAPAVEAARPEPAHSPNPKDTSPLASRASQAAPSPVVEPRKPLSPGGERPTTIIDSSAMAPPPRPASAPQPSQPSKQTAPPREREVRPPSRQEADHGTPAAPSIPKKARISPVYTLVGLNGQYKGQVREIDTKEYVVGRDPASCDLVIDRTESGELENSVSREHFTIISTDEGLFILDKKSRLRTFVNGKVIEPNQRESIAPEDILCIPVPTGEVKFRLCFKDNENFKPDSGKSKYMPLILGLVGIIIVLLVAAFLLLGDK